MKSPILNIKFKAGSVWLAGAGPGDPGLVTLQTWHAIQHADIIVYDALVSAEILKIAPEKTTKEYAGKRGGKPSVHQADISLRLIQLARKNLRVLRLKGGDPLVFGRGGEEALALVKAGIPFRILPGLTAGIGGLAYAGIPLTHRDTNHAVTLVTGHDATGRVANLNWRALSESAPVLVIYMALKHIKIIAVELIKAGRLPDEPVAVITNASTPKQRVLETSLQKCHEDILSGNFKPPAIIVVGQTVQLRKGLDWLGASQGRELDPDPLSLSSYKETG